MAVHVVPSVLAGPVKAGLTEFIATACCRITRGIRVESVTTTGGSKGAAPRRPAYEQARDELTELVKRLEAGGLTLEQSLQLWERGEELAAICQEWLEGARARLATALAKNADPQGAPGTPF